MQLELFDRRRGTVIMFHFPLARRADLIRETVKELAGRSYAQGKRYWSQHVQKVRKDLKAAGRSPQDIEAEITAYAQAVRRGLFSSTPERATR
jgi:hypothetical protein